MSKECDTAADTDDVKSTNTEIDTPISCIWCNKKSCWRFWHSCNSYWRLVGAASIVFLYLLIGGGIFTAVERPNELRMIEESTVARENAISNFIDTIVNLTNLTEEEAVNLTISFLEFGQVAAEAAENLTFDSNPIWDYSSAVFFCSTVITTIGYGTIAPSTATGQIIFIFYAIIGIPLALIFLTMIGDIIDSWVGRVLKPVERRWGPIISRTVGSVSLFLTVLIFFVLIPAAIYDVVETWNFRESIYFTVVTLTTVGFGDFVPASATTGISSALTGLYKLMSACWLWMGLALVAALISEIQSLLKSLGEKFRTNPCCGVFAKKFEREKSEKEVASMDEEDPDPSSPPDEEATAA